MRELLTATVDPEQTCEEVAERATPPLAKFGRSLRLHAVYMLYCAYF